MKYKNILTSIIVGFSLSSCYYDNEEYLYGIPECADSVSFKNDVQPIISSSCASSACHGADQDPLLTDYSSISAKADRIQFRTGNGTMPPSGPLSADDIQTIKCWVEQGALNN